MILLFELFKRAFDQTLRVIKRQLRFKVFLGFTLFAHHLHFAESAVKIVDQVILVFPFLPYLLLVPVFLTLLLRIQSALGVWSVDSFWKW